MKKNDMKKDYKIRIFKSDLPELRDRIQFLTGNSWDISIGIDGVEDVKGECDDGRMIINKIPKDWPAEVVLEWLRRRKTSRQKVMSNMREEISHLQFVEDLVSRQLEKDNNGKNNR